MGWEGGEEGRMVEWGKGKNCGGGGGDFLKVQNKSVTAWRQHEIGPRAMHPSLSPRDFRCVGEIGTTTFLGRRFI